MRYTDLKDEICSTWLQLNDEQMAQVRIALLDISSLVGEYPRMREISRCVDVSSALRLLEKWKLLTPAKVDILLRLSRNIGLHTEMVQGRIEHYKKVSFPLNSSQTSSTSHIIKKPHSHPDPLLHNPVFDEVCEYLSENLRGRWADLGRSLGLASLVSELFHEPAVRQRDKTYRILEEFKRQNKADTMPRLLQALNHCGLNRQRNHIMREILTR